MLTPKPAQIPEPSASGSLAKRPFAHLLIYALDRKLTGTFELADANGAAAYVVVADGWVARVETNEPVTYLGHVLYELGSIDDATLSASLATVAATRALHGQILLEQAAITDLQLAEALRQQRARKLQHVFSLEPTTTFAFYANLDFAGARPGDVEPMDPMPAIWRGVRQHPSWDHVRAAMAGVAGRALRLIPDANLDRFELDANEHAAAQCLARRGQTVPELAIVGGLTIQQTDLLAYFLVITKQAEVVNAVSASQPPPVSTSLPPGGPFASGEYARKISFSLRGVNSDAGTVRIPSPLPERMPSPLPGRLSQMPGRVMSPLPPRVTPSPPTGRVASSPPGRVASVPPAVAALRSAPPGSGPPPSNSPSSSPSNSPSGSQSGPPASSAVPGVLPPASDLARKKSIVDRARWIDQEDYFKMLMLPRDCDAEDVRAAYLRAAKVWHPDSLPLSIIEVRADCERVFNRITAAYETLVDSEKRRAYERQITARNRESADADHFMSEAEMHLTLGDRDSAEALARKAVVAAPTLGEARALLAHIESRDPRRGKEDNLRSFVKTLDMAIGADPMCRRAHYYRALLHKRLGDHEAAVRDLRAAATTDPDDVEAQRELRVYEQKLREGSIKLRSMSPFGRKDGGFFDRLRKK